MITVRFTGVYDHADDCEMEDQIGEGATVDEAWDFVLSALGRDGITYDDWQAA